VISFRLIKPGEAIRGQAKNQGRANTGSISRRILLRFQFRRLFLVLFLLQLPLLPFPFCPPLFLTSVVIKLFISSAIMMRQNKLECSQASLFQISLVSDNNQCPTLWVGSLSYLQIMDLPERTKKDATRKRLPKGKAQYS